LPNEEILINCRATQISQVLFNLIGNSHDAIENLNEKWIKIIVIKTKDDAEVFIIDSGKGISKDLQDKIMHPFFKRNGVRIKHFSWNY
jgi:phosphoglycerate-specific signal transduction histidine kinase